jgi:hypothetical protein
LSAVATFAYISLPLGLALVAGARPAEDTSRVLLIFIVAGTLGFCLYFVVPAAAPAFLFRADFPWHVPSLQWTSVRPAVLPGDAPRNAMPSLHFGWALLMFWNTRLNRWWIRFFAAAYLIVIFASTLGLGEHYLIDLVVALPFALTIQALCTRSTANLFARDSAVAFGATVTAGWILLLRFAVPHYRLSPTLIWIATAVTLTGSLWLKRKLVVGTSIWHERPLGEQFETAFPKDAPSPAKTHL